MAGRPPIDLNQKVRDLLKHTIDDRFKLFSAKGDSLASHFNAGSVGRAMCESDTWLSNQTINERFRQILKPHFDKPWEYLFPAENDLPTGERARAKTLEILWQVRHNITHNTGFLTEFGRETSDVDGKSPHCLWRDAEPQSE